MKLRLGTGGAAVAILVCACLGYGLLAGNLLSRPSIAPYFVDLANAFRDGKLFIEHPTNYGYDMIQYDGRWYVAQPPLPAIVALPFVIVQGADGTSDVSVGVICGALSAMLCGVALRRIEPSLSVGRWLGVVALFAFGTVQVSLSVMGTVWFLGQVVAALCLWGFILSVIGRKPLLAGALAGLVFLSRPTILPACGVFALGWWYLDQRASGEESPGRSAGRMRAYLLWFGLALIPFFVLFGAYNAVRFGSPFDPGYNYIAESTFALHRREMFGTFHPAFLPENLYIAFLKPLQFHPGCLFSGECGVITTDLRGSGLLWTSPAILIYALAARPASRREAYRYGLYAAAALLALAPGLLYHNTGEAQFGYRFALDALPFAMLLVAAGARRGPLWLLAGLVAASALINIWGAKWLINTLAYAYKR